ncbi:MULTISPECIES: YlxR family protein [Rothia]|uniref:YlxR family protein n=1 Tax=Rothia TaxID=32207 RepID=UPI00214B5AE7|nr:MULTISPECIES: YlxR family protein [Rothia]
MGCRTTAPAPNLIRVALIQAEPPRAVFDEARNLPGRGAWLHRTPECLAQALSKNALARAFRTRVNAAELVITA